MKLNKKLQNIANESLEIYNNEEFLTELLNMVKTPVIIEKPFKLNKAVVSGVALGLVLVVAVPVIIRATTGLNQTEVPKSNSAQTSNSTQYAPSPAPTDSDTSISNSTEVSTNEGNGTAGEALTKFSCNYQTETDTFDLNNVSLTYFFGGSFYPDIEIEYINGSNIPYFDIIIKNDDGDEIIYKHFDEDFMQEKFRRTVTTVDTIFININYNYSEIIAIPKEIFTKQSGRIEISIWGEYWKKSDHPYIGITGIPIDYEINDGKVKLIRPKYTSSWSV